MAAHTISGQKWANGTSVSVYPAASWPDPSRAPSGTAVATAAVTGGAVTFAGLAEQVRYVAYAAGVGVTFMVPHVNPMDARSLRDRVDDFVGDLQSVETRVAELETKVFYADDPAYGMVADGVTDAAAPMRLVVAAARNFITATGIGARIELPPGKLAWKTAPSTPPPGFAGAAVGVGIPTNLLGRLSIVGAGRGATTIVLSDTCRSAFYCDHTGATMSITTVSGSPSVAVSGVTGTLAVGQMFGNSFATNIPGGTVIGAISGTGPTYTITLGQAASPSTPVNATANGSTSSVKAWGRDTFQNVTLEDFDVDNNNASGRCAAVIGNRIESNSSTYYLSFANVSLRRIRSYSFPWDGSSTLTTTNKDLVSFVGLHPSNDLTSYWLTSSTDIECEDLVGIDCQNGIRVASYNNTTTALNHYYNNISYRRCRHEKTGHAYPDNTLQETSFYICAAGYGDYCEVIDCYSENSGDDGIELGGMQRIIIDGFRCKNPWFEGIMLRNTQDPPNLATQEIVIRNTTVSVDSTINVSAGTPQGLFFAMDIDTVASGLGTATGMGNVKLEDCELRLKDVAWSKLSRTGIHANVLGYNVVASNLGPNRVEMVRCKFAAIGFTYDSASSLDLACVLSNLTPTIVFDSNATSHAPGVHIIRDFAAHIDSSSVTSTGVLSLEGFRPVGQGVVDVDGFDMRVTNMTVTNATNLVASYVDVGKGGTYRTMLLRRFRGLTANNTNTAVWGVRFFNSGTWSSTLSQLLIEACDFSSWTNVSSSYRDLDIASAPSNLSLFMTLRNNHWNRDSNAIPYGGHVSTAANLTLQYGHRSVDVTDTTAARTITLPDRRYWPAGIENAITVVDSSNAAATNNITVSRGGGDSFVGGATTKVINTNAGSLRVAHNGTSLMVV